tara:strand:- start:4544 stop:5764 length:1221 start_codon:yes stop_codon:yes gene_type:complete
MSEIRVDTISEKTSANGVSIDSVTLKDGNVGAAGTATSVAGIPLFSDTTNGSIYTHDVSGTDSTAQYNTAYGLTAMDAITTGDDNIAIGYGAAGAMTTGSDNIAIGSNALDAEDTGTQNIAIGYNALTAMNFDSDGNNICIGYKAGESITSGRWNIGIGTESIDGFDTEHSNLGIGFRALGGSIAGGEYNVAIGNSSGLVVTSGDNNTFVGYYAGSAANSGDANTCVGTNAGNVITTSTSNTCIGMDTDPSSATSSGHEIVIGKNAVGKGTSTGFISANGGANYAGNNSASWSTTSDRRIKKNIENNNTGLDKLKQIQVRNFEYRLPEEIDPELPSHAAIEKEGIQVGVIAQEVMDILPDIVKQESTGCYTVDPDNITWYLVNAVQELSDQIKTLQEEINLLKEGN